MNSPKPLSTTPPIKVNIQKQSRFNELLSNKTTKHRYQNQQKHQKAYKTSKITFGKLPNYWHIKPQLRHPQMTNSVGVVLCVQFFRF